MLSSSLSKLPLADVSILLGASYFVESAPLINFAHQAKQPSRLRFKRRISVAAIQSALGAVEVPTGSEWAEIGLNWGRQSVELPFGFVAVLVVIVVIYFLSSIKILAEYERGVIFRLGRLLDAAKGPGVIFVFAPIDRIVRVSLRQEALEVPPQDIITRDNVTLKVNAVIFLRVIEPRKAVVEVSNYVYQTSQFAQTTLRSVLGEQELDELLAHRDKINMRLQSILDTHTSPWGVKVTNVEVKQVDMPESMLRAMAKQAEAEREKRSKIIHAEGEFSAAQRLVDAAHLLSSEPVSVQLRYLQTLTEIGVEKNTTVVFPVPVDFFSGIQKLLSGGNPAPPSPGKTA
jgi:regulator of protease activity HflC (stomatin/prohibitin superfamily)